MGGATRGQPGWDGMSAGVGSCLIVFNLLILQRRKLRSRWRFESPTFPSWGLDQAPGAFQLSPKAQPRSPQTQKGGEAFLLLPSPLGPVPSPTEFPPRWFTGFEREACGA